MKKWFLLFNSVLLTCLGVAQNTSEHLTFKGVPIDGSAYECARQLEYAGFTLVNQLDYTALLVGDFAGYRDCMIGVSALPSVNVVNTIGVIFPSCAEWADLERNYTHLKEMLTKKYGKPKRVVEQFQGYNVTTNSDKLHELRMGRCNWVTVFEVPKGMIQLSIESHDYAQHYVLLKYFDQMNTALVENASMEDL